MTALAILGATLIAAALTCLLAALALARTADRPAPDPVDDAYRTLPAGRPELRIDTRTGNHDRYPHMHDNARDIVIGYCEAMWHTPTRESR